jgi:hypothetical protein
MRYACFIKSKDALKLRALRDPALIVACCLKRGNTGLLSPMTSKSFKMTPRLDYLKGKEALAEKRGESLPMPKPPMPIVQEPGAFQRESRPRCALPNMS